MKLPWCSDLAVFRGVFYTGRILLLFINLIEYTTICKVSFMCLVPSAKVVNGHKINIQVKNICIFFKNIFIGWTICYKKGILSSENDVI